eukprot:CAMPEP_0118885218 /NCGR_PEP_ID=MMETSP1163-20130328/23771_1 /TAXON_ID=124430 /ORGANISM="Phaeomonas parva, Strain CCMP2877" /LENGTH=40 /DNA_ID= /DNA_START= /DNA_END= /DNA_ORIENTATION=
MGAGASARLPEGQDAFTEAELRQASYAQIPSLTLTLTLKP